MFIFVATRTWTDATYHSIYSLRQSATPVPRWVFNRKTPGTNISMIKTP